MDHVFDCLFQHISRNAIFNEVTDLLDQVSLLPH